MQFGGGMRNLLLLFLCLFFSTLFTEYSADRLIFEEQKYVFRSHALVDLVRACNAVWYDVQQFWQADDDFMKQLLGELDQRLEEIYTKINDLSISQQEVSPSFFKYLTHLMHMITKELNVFVCEFGTCQEIVTLMHKVKGTQELLLIARERFDVA